MRCLILSCDCLEMPYTHVPVALKEKNTRWGGVLFTVAWVTSTWAVPNKLYPAPAFCCAWVARYRVALVCSSWVLYAIALHVSETVMVTVVASAPGWCVLLTVGLHGNS